MPVRAEIIRALDDFIANEGGMKFQHLAVALGRMRWRELVASERRADLGLDAHASALLSPDGIGQGLASSTTTTLEKISADAERAVTRKRQEPWVSEIRSKYGLELTLIEPRGVRARALHPNAP